MTKYFLTVLFLPEEYLLLILNFLKILNFKNNFIKHIIVLFSATEQILYQKNLEN